MDFVLHSSKTRIVFSVARSAGSKNIQNNLTVGLVSVEVNAVL